MGYTSYDVTYPDWIYDESSIDRLDGRQIYWAGVDPSRDNADGKGVIESGTIMAVLASGQIVPRADVAAGLGDVINTETSIGILIATVVEDANHAALSGHGLAVGGVIFENLLPDSGAGAFATWKGELQTAGTRFMFLTHANSAAS